MRRRPAREIVKWLALIESRLEHIQQALERQNQEISDMATDLTALAAEVAEDTDVTNSAVTVINELKQAIIDAGGNQEAVDALTAQLDANTNALAAAIAQTEPTP